MKKRFFFIENVNDKILELIIDIEKIISEQSFLFSNILEKKSQN